MADRRNRRDFTREEVLALLSYDPVTGIFRWKIETHGHGGAIHPGDEAGTIKDGYRHIILFGRQYRAQHLAWLIMTGEWPTGFDIDHENRSRDDNRWDNLREATRSQNNINSGPHRNNKSGRKGVSWRKDTQKWHARIVVDGRTLLLGDFHELQEAIAARDEAEKHHYGEFAFSKRSAA
ncbi:HNH endonuclease signature motif containing protein [Aurantimonas sp. NFXS3]|uniref:HNH endonuclease signature motif containing protein n=1 Tax=Aurantimonas sp. NFXS3 TaxID=2818434 RepID=UPI003B8DE87D